MAKEITSQTVKRYRIGVGVFVFFLISWLLLYVGIPSLSRETYINELNNVIATTTDISIEDVIPPVPVRQTTHVPTPSAVKGIYMTSCVAGTPSLRQKLVALIDETELNSIVLDVKSYDGNISFMPEDEELKLSAGKGCFVSDMQDFIDDLHVRGIYVIARVAVFQDALMVSRHPELAVKMESATTTVWRDHKGIPWIDASAKPYWDYIVEVARESHNIGFDEINFDYIRFPSDGNMKDIYYPFSGDQNKSLVMKSFFEYLNRELGDEMIISADLFGMTTTNEDDLGIGQVLEYALPNFDYIAPMVYPSHYPKGFMNFSDPNAHVYEVVKYSMDRAVERARATTTKVFMPDARIGTSTPAIYAKNPDDIQKLRPWLQDNNYPVTYTAEMVRAQIQATYDSGLTSWLLWNAGNRYTRDALTAEGD